MDFRYLFLEPQGRLAPRPFARGLVLLTGAFMLQYTLVFPYVCLFGKRLHDAGLSAWLWLAFLAGFGLLNVLLSAMLLPALSPQAYAVQTEMQKIMIDSGFNAAMEALSARAAEISRLSAVTSVAALLIASAITGFTAYRLRSDPKPNKHGRPTLGGPADTFS
jgi:hypothetical protein